MEQMEVDTCIIGAGFAGLAAGYKLKHAGKSIIILEARNRVGGRVYTHTLPDGTPINRGGTWLGAGHDRMNAIAKEMKIETYRQYNEGDNIMIINDKTYRYSGMIPRMNPLKLLDFGLALKTLDRMATQVPLHAPWNAKQAKEWDSQTIGAWLSSSWHPITRTAQKMLMGVFCEMFMSDPREVSLLHALHLVHSLRSLEWVVSSIGGAQQDLVVGGMQSIANRLANELGEEALYLENPVQYIQQNAENVLVTAKTLTVNARQVICAIPPILATRIKFDPLLPPLKSQLMDRSPAGQGIKWHAVYPEPFWRENGLTGQASDMDEVPEASLDCTPQSGQPGILAGFAFGPSARKLATISSKERQEIWLNGLVKRFGHKAAKPILVDEYDWAADPWSHGDMFAHYAPGVITGFGTALREPCGRIYWAGTETATEWSGSIEGAVRSGERAAEEVLHANC